MDVVLKIGDGERSFFEADEHWIIDQINKRQKEGFLVCVQVIIDFGNRKLRLTTPACVGSACVGLPPTPQEKHIFELWEQLGMNREDFNGGKLVAFRSHLRKIL
jgi:hypothetical protein